MAQMIIQRLNKRNKLSTKKNTKTNVRKKRKTLKNIVADRNGLNKLNIL